MATLDPKISLWVDICRTNKRVYNFLQIDWKKVWMDFFMYEAFLSNLWERGLELFVDWIMKPLKISSPIAFQLMRSRFESSNILKHRETWSELLESI